MSDRFWMSPAGELHNAGGSHVDWLIKHPEHGLISPDTSIDYGSRAMLSVAFQLGWQRILTGLGPNGTIIQVENYSIVPNPKQKEELMKYALRTGCNSVQYSGPLGLHTIWEESEKTSSCEQARQQTAGAEAAKEQPSRQVSPNSSDLYWMSPTGDLHNAGSSHVKWLLDHPELELIPPGTDPLNGYEAMKRPAFEKGWRRCVMRGGRNGKTLHAENEYLSLSPEQLKALIEFALETGHTEIRHSGPEGNIRVWTST